MDLKARLLIDLWTRLLIDLWTRLSIDIWIWNKIGFNFNFILIEKNILEIF